MSHCVPTPLKPVKQHQQKVLTIVSPKAKLFFVLVALLLYVAIIIFFKTIMEKCKRYCQLECMVMETKQMIRQIYAMDLNLAVDMINLDYMFMNY